MIKMHLGEGSISLLQPEIIIKVYRWATLCKPNDKPKVLENVSRIDAFLLLLILLQGVCFYSILMFVSVTVYFHR